MPRGGHQICGPGGTAESGARGNPPKDALELENQSTGSGRHPREISTRQASGLDLGEEGRAPATALAVHGCIHTCTHTHTRTRAHLLCSPCTKEDLPPPGMAYSSLYLPIPFPLLGPPAMFILFIQQICGALLCTRYLERYLSLKRRKEKLCVQRVKEKEKEAMCPSCVFREKCVSCVCVHASVHMHPWSRM